MKIRNIVHRGLRRFIKRDDPSGLSPLVVERVRNIVTFLQEMADARELRDVPCFELYLNSPQNARPEDLLTVIHVPVG